MNHHPQAAIPAEVTAIHTSNPISSRLNGLPDRIMLRAEVELAVGRKKSWLYAAIARNEFPAPFSLGGSRVAWWLSDIAAYLEELKRKQQESA